MRVHFTNSTQRTNCDCTRTSDALGRGDAMRGGTHTAMDRSLYGAMHRATHPSCSVHGGVHRTALASIDLLDVPQSNK